MRDIKRCISVVASAKHVRVYPMNSTLENKCCIHALDILTTESHTLAQVRVQVQVVQLHRQSHQRLP